MTSTDEVLINETREVEVAGAFSKNDVFIVVEGYAAEGPVDRNQDGIQRHRLPVLLGFFEADSFRGRFDDDSSVNQVISVNEVAICAIRIFRCAMKPSPRVKTKDRRRDHSHSTGR